MVEQVDQLVEWQVVSVDFLVQSSVPALIVIICSDAAVKYRPAH